MSFHFRCPHCNTKLEAEDDWAGLEAVCPKCEQQIVLLQAVDSDQTISQNQNISAPLSLFTFLRKKWYFWSSCILILTIVIVGSCYYGSVQPQKVKTPHTSESTAISRQVQRKESPHIPAATSTSNSDEIIKTTIPIIPDFNKDFPFTWGASPEDCRKFFKEFKFSHQADKTTAAYVGLDDEAIERVLVFMRNRLTAVGMRNFTNIPSAKMEKLIPTIFNKYQMIYSSRNEASTETSFFVNENTILNVQLGNNKLFLVLQGYKKVSKDGITLFSFAQSD